MVDTYLAAALLAFIVIAVAAVEAAVAIAIIINIYRHFTTINVEDVDEMKY